MSKAAFRTYDDPITLSYENMNFDPLLQLNRNEINYKFCVLN